MKLAEALMLRSDLQKRAASLKERVVRNVIVQEGDRPSEDPEDLFRQVEEVHSHLEGLIPRINRINLQHTLEGGESLTDALARRDVLQMRHNLFNAAAQASAKGPDRYSMKEIKWVSVVDVAALQRRADDLAREIRELNARIQEANWRIEMED